MLNSNEAQLSVLSLHKSNSRPTTPTTWGHLCIPNDLMGIFSICRESVCNGSYLIRMYGATTVEEALALMDTMLAEGLVYHVPTMFQPLATDLSYHASNFQNDSEFYRFAVTTAAGKRLPTRHQTEGVPAGFNSFDSIKVRKYARVDNETRAKGNARCISMRECIFTLISIIRWS